MRESMGVFIENQGNASAVKALESINGLRPVPLRLFIEGPHHAGKSALVRGWAEDAAKNGAGDSVFACSGADIAIALQFEADDSFFEKLGSTPVLIIDDLEPLLRTEKGDQLLSLMLHERDRQGLHTVITSQIPLTECTLEESRETLDSFEVVTIEPLDEEGKRAFARKAEAEYGSETHPELSDDAVACIIELANGRFADIENAVRYLVTDEDCTSRETLDASAIKELLHR
ncbi:hypothetical protein [Raoultibacter massiliensis]|uniref:hypothetical protein n=1 Tax=Raoultibacter massiliensis TaxID=1852371 RepID=UPI0011AFB927|nr:hypothetical protein [Raoultibacter massiliensis]